MVAMATTGTMLPNVATKIAKNFKIAYTTYANAFNINPFGVRKNFLTFKESN